MQCTLDGRLFGISRAESRLGVHTGDSHEIQVGPHSGSGIDQGGADVHHRMPEQSSTEHDYLYPAVRGEFHGDVRAVGDQRRFEIGREMPGHLDGCRAAVQNDHLAGSNHCSACPAERDLLADRDGLADAEVAVRE